MEPLSAVNLARDIRAGRESAEDLLSRCLARVDEKNLKLNAFVHVNRDGALSQARAVDRAVREGRDPGRLAGLPIAVKDNLLTRDQPTSVGSALLKGWTPPYDAAVVERVRKQGAVLLGKTNLDEFSMGSSCEHSVFGPTRNPLDPARVAGGSSGGSAAAVASGMAVLGLGTDTGGSVRQPAAFCGLVGMAPTYGRVSRWGLVAFASSLDTVGPIARTVSDAALLASVIAGPDPRDATCSGEEAEDYLARLDGKGKPGCLGVPEEVSHQDLSPEVERGFLAGVSRLEKTGWEIRSIRLPRHRCGLAAYHILATAEASANLARYDGIRFGPRLGPGEDLEEMIRSTRGAGFGPEVRRRILLGTFVLRAGAADRYYAKAKALRSMIRQDFTEVFQDGVDAVLTPTTPTPAFPLGEKTLSPVEMYRSDTFTAVTNLAGLPAVSVPVSVGNQTLPVGLMIAAPPFGEGRALAIARALERSGEVSG